MSIEVEFRELFSESASFYPSASVDKYGKRAFSASPVVAPAHLVSETILTRDMEGREVVETGRIFLYGNYSITTDHRVLLQDGASPVIISVDTPHDQNGPHHTVVRIGRGRSG